MEKKGRITYLIKSYFPDEYDIVGNGITSDLIDAHLNDENIEMLHSEYGRNMDIFSIISIVSGTIQIIDFIIQRMEKINLRNNKESEKNTTLIVSKVKTYIESEIPDLDYEFNVYEKIIKDLMNEKQGEV